MVELHTALASLDGCKPGTVVIETREGETPLVAKKAPKKEKAAAKEQG